MNMWRLLCGFVLASIVASSAFALDAESDAWAAAKSVSKTAADGTMISRYADARTAFEAFMKAYPTSAHAD
jgi:TolA-binding protein